MPSNQSPEIEEKRTNGNNKSPVKSSNASDLLNGKNRDHINTTIEVNQIKKNMSQDNEINKNANMTHSFIPQSAIKPFPNENNKFSASEPIPNNVASPLLINEHKKNGENISKSLPYSTNNTNSEAETKKISKGVKKCCIPMNEIDDVRKHIQKLNPSDFAENFIKSKESEKKTQQDIVIIDDLPIKQSQNRPAPEKKMIKKRKISRIILYLKESKKCKELLEKLGNTYHRCIYLKYLHSFRILKRKNNL